MKLKNNYHTRNYAKYRSDQDEKIAQLKRDFHELRMLVEFLANKVLGDDDES